MRRLAESRNDHVALDLVTTSVGAWLVLSPFVLGIAAETFPLAAWSFLLTGGVIMLIGIAALTSFRDWEEWVSLAAAIWLMASPWILGFSTQPVAMWNAIVSASVVAICSLVALSMSEPVSY